MRQCPGAFAASTAFAMTGVSRCGQKPNFWYRPTGRALGREDRAERVRRTWYFADKVAKTYGVSPRVALIGAVFTTNVPGVAAGALTRNGFSPEEGARFWTLFVLGGWAAVAARYGAQPFAK